MVAERGKREAWSVLFGDALIYLHIVASLEPTGAAFSLFDSRALLRLFQRPCRAERLRCVPRSSTDFGDGGRRWPTESVILGHSRSVGPRIGPRIARAGLRFGVPIRSPIRDPDSGSWAPIRAPDRVHLGSSWELISAPSESGQCRFGSPAP